MKKNRFLLEFVCDDCRDEARFKLEKILLEAFNMGKNDCTEQMFKKHMEKLI